MKNLDEFFILDSMTEQELDKIREFSYRQKCESGDIIYLEGAEGRNLYLILEGMFKVYKSGGQGKEKTLNLLGPGEFFGESSLQANCFYTNSVKALSQGRLLTISREQFKRVIEVSPEVALKTIGVLSERLQHANNEIKDLTFKSIEERLVGVLLELGEKFGVKTETGVRLRHKFTHQELAELVGTTRETVTKLLGRLQADKLIEVENRTIFLTGKLYQEYE